MSNRGCSIRGVSTLAAALLASTGVAETFVVNDLGPDPDADVSDARCATAAGACTLAAAIQQANVTPGVDSVVFSVAGTTRAAGAVTDTITIDATTAPSHTGTPSIIIDGASIILDRSSDGSTLRGLAIQGVSGNGLSIYSDENTIVGCHFGADTPGNTAKGNQAHGVYVAGSNNFIGGGTYPERVVASGNGGDGVHVAAGSLANDIQHVFAGVNRSGSTAIPNGGSGITVLGIGNSVRHSLASGNATYGVTVAGTNNVVVLSVIGLSSDGKNPLPNGHGGVNVNGTTNDIGISRQGNTISGNTGPGIAGYGRQNRIRGNLIGTNQSGTEPASNSGSGIVLFESQAYWIGDDLPGAGNVISGNAQSGVAIVSGGGHSVAGNSVGTDWAGERAIPNGADGILIVNSSHNGIGSNVVAGNGRDGLHVAGAFANNNGAAANSIGLAAGGGHLPNGRHGVIVLEGAHANVIGEGNRIVANHGVGVAILGGDSNSVRRNRILSNGRLAIDLDADATEPLDGVTYNDRADSDSGPNALQNTPVLKAATVDSVTGVVRGEPAGQYLVDLFGSFTCDVTGFGEASVVLGTRLVTADATGLAMFDFALTPVMAMPFFTATATGPSNATSELSQCLRLGHRPVDTLALTNPAMNFVSQIGSPENLPPLDAYWSYGTAPPGQGQWVFGDWEGDGIETAALYRDDGAFFYTNEVGPTSSWTGIWFGFPGPPVAGRFDPAIDHDCLGALDSIPVPGVGTGFAVYFTCDLTSGPTPDLRAQWIGPVLPDSQGFTGTFQFAAGDFDGDGVQTMAVRRGLHVVWTNVPVTTVEGRYEHAQYLGAPAAGEGQIVAGDWDGNRLDSFGLFYPNGAFFRRDDLEWNSGAYTLQNVGQPIGSPVTASSWRPGGSPGQLP